MNNNPNIPVPNLVIGSIIEVDGTHLIAELDPNIEELSRVYDGLIYPIGQFGSIVKIHFGANLLFAYVGRLRMKSDYERELGKINGSNESERVIEMDLFGEGEWVFDSTADEWQLKFSRGVASFPLPLQKVYLTPISELRFIYGQGDGSTILLGEHSGSSGTECHADMNELLGKHTAILGSTGSGKSGTVASIIHSILDRGREKNFDSWNPQIVILDPHNEYGEAFSNNSRLSTDEGTLNLPYWLLNLQESVGLLIGKTEFVATSQTNIIKTSIILAKEEAALALSIDPSSINVDSPVPYSLERLIYHINNSTNLPSAASKQDPWNSILNKLEILRNDSRMAFMMAEWDGTDTFTNTMKQLMGSENPIRIIDLSGLPNEIAGLASSVIARMLFSIKLWQTSEERKNNPVLLVCEEAHRYVPNRGDAQYEAAQEAIRRIAKEGRKYGIGLMLVSQRPSEIEATVLSQCNSWIVHRITNELDRKFVQGILPDSLGNLTKMLSGLRQREAIFAGQAAILPSRIVIRNLVEAGKALPRSHDVDFDSGWRSANLDEAQLKIIGDRWRQQSRETI